MATVNDVNLRARDVINDTASVRWTEKELCRWVTDALALMGKALPSLFSKRSGFTCAAGAAQRLGFDRSLGLVEVVGVLPCQKSALDAFGPAWQTGLPGSALHWMPGDAGPNSFLVYPPSAAGQVLTVAYVESPAEVTDKADVLPDAVDDYVSALADYVIGMASAKDDEAVNAGRAQSFIASFHSKLGASAPANQGA